MLRCTATTSLSDLSTVLRCCFFELQRQQLQQQAPGVDVLVVAADVCNRAAMERAVKEHVSR